MPVTRAFPKRLARALAVVGVTTAILFALGLFLFFHNRPDRSQVEAEQYAVYSAYIAQGLTGESHDLGSRGGLVVILSRTIISDRFVNRSKRTQYGFLLTTLPNAKRNLRPLPAWAVMNLLLANFSEEQLEPHFTIPARYKLASEADTSYPERFTRRFPGHYGYLTFTRVGFNRNLTQALFYTEHVCGLCGGGEYVHMRKIKGVWVIQGRSSTWVS